MTIEDIIQHWIETAENDLQAAESNFNSGHYDWALFIGHLVIEKILKAHWVKYNQQLNPPRTHNLVRLAKQSIIELSREQEDFLGLVTTFNIEARYPEFKQEFYRIATKEFTTKNLIKIKELYQWLKSLLT
ncbi:HEPN domain-containing protein [Bacteroidota bacterium]